MAQISSTNSTVLITFDVEDWFQVENFKDHIPYSTWDQRELRVEKNTYQILDLLDSLPVSVKATFFILGWIAEKCPDVVREIHRRGHEIASHGFGHHLCFNQKLNELQIDLQKSKDLLESTINEAISGYRAPSFSITDDALRLVEKAGYLYDSSYNSYKGNSRYGSVRLPDNETHNSYLYRISHSFYEIPISNLKLGKRIFPWGGGGYFRLLPSFIHQLGVNHIIKEHKCYTFYLHPWEIDPDQPKVSAASPVFRFRHYVNLHRTKTKLKKFISSNAEYEFSTIKAYIDKNFMGNKIHR